MKGLGGQRALVFTLTALVLLIIGAFLGQPGQFPVVESQTVFTPDYVFELVAGLIAPFMLLVQNFSSLLRAISSRANNPDDPFKPSDMKSLFASKELWVYVVGAIVGIGQIFGAKVLAEDVQIIIANGLMFMTKYLLDSWAERGAGEVQEVTSITLSSPVSSTLSETVIQSS